jgi:uncharacterized surface protein with fasciclin (FAS1) repeats
MMFRKLGFVVSMCGALIAAAAVSAEDKTPAKVTAAKPVLESAQLNIVKTAAKNGEFKTLVTALREAGLVDTLEGKGPFTVFAPTDKAFAKLPKGTLDSLLKPENKAKLAAILKYHVVAGKVLAADAAKLKSAETLDGEPIRISTERKQVMINNAKVTQADIQCTNGVIHVIDTVLMPKE